MSAPSGTVWGSKVGDDNAARLGIYKSISSTNDETTLTVEIWFWSRYSISDTSNTLYYNNRSESGSASTKIGSVSISTSNDSSWSTSNQKRLKKYTYTYSRTKTAKTRYLYAKLTGIDKADGTLYVSTTVTIPKLPTYTVTYNANGGSSAPDKSTKYYGIDLTLSSSTPTRNGYIFRGWATTSTSNVRAYEAGDTYTQNKSITLYAIWLKITYMYLISYDVGDGENAPVTQTKNEGESIILTDTVPRRAGYDFYGWDTDASATTVIYQNGQVYTEDKNITLYAVWKIKTYSITYDIGNDAVGGPDNQIKTHGQSIKISNIVPTKTDYDFKGWSVSSTNGQVSYKPGDMYTLDSNIKLYPVWESSYFKPVIYDLEYFRSNEHGNEVDDTLTQTSCCVTFYWSTYYDISSVVISWVSSSGEISGSKILDDVSGTWGVVNYVFGDNSLPMDQAFVITLSVTDERDSTVKYITLEGSMFPIDMLGNGGKGIAFGKPAELEGYADCGYIFRARNGMVVDREWNRLTLNTSVFTTGRSNDNSDIAYKNLAGLITIRGIVEVTAALSSGSTVLLASGLPEECISDIPLHFLCATDGFDSCRCVIDTDGCIYADNTVLSNENVIYLCCTYQV